MLATPLVFMLVKSPALAILQIGAGLALLGIRIAVHAVTLPVEFDASFGKALPVLTRGRYLSPAIFPPRAACSPPPPSPTSPPRSPR